MTVVWAAVLAAAAAASLVGLPRAGAVRAQAVLRPVSQEQVPGAAHGPVGVGGRSLRGSWAVLAAAGGSLVVVVLVGPQVLVPVLLVTAGAVAGLRVRRTRAQATARRDERARAVEACSALAGELRAGRSPADALDAAAELGTGPFAVALRTAAGAVRLGGDPAPSLRATPDCAVPEVLRALAACWTVCAGSGGGLATAVERLEEGLRAEQAQRRAVDAELAGPRATAGLLAVLPAGGLLLAAGLGADPLSVLLTTPFGLLCLTVGLGLDALGVWWTGRLVASAGGRP